MAETLAQLGFTGMPLSDEASFAGLPAAIKAAKKFNMNLVAGQRYSFSPTGTIHLFPDNEKAYEWINRLASFSATRQDPSGMSLLAFLKKHQPAGNGRCVISSDNQHELAAIFASCNWNVYLSLPPRKSIKDLAKLVSMAEKYNLRLILSPDLLCADPGDANTVRMIRAISRGSLFSDIPDFDLNLPQIPAAFSQLAGQYPQAAANNLAFSEQSSWVPPQNTLKMPSYGESAEETVEKLRSIAFSKLSSRYPSITREIEKRFNYEMETIIKLGFADYFMVVYDITTKAKELGHRVLGRGSAANSLISYALDFTQVDPIKYNLYFERFLNEARRSPPDIDLDFSWRIRDQIYQFLLDRWCSDNVALICTHISLRGRAAIRETGKALGYKNEDINFASSLIKAPSISHFLQNPPAWSRFPVPPDRLKLLTPMIKLAAMVENIPTHYSIHAGGVVIAPGTIYNFTPVVPASKVLPITQLEMHGIEQFGLVKLDLLSQRSLGVYSDLVVQTANMDSADQCPAKPEEIEADPKVMSAIAAGNTLGVFYIESPGMRGLLAKLRCRTYSGLVAASSIIRPGVAESGMMQEYIRRHHQPDNWTPVHPLMGELLAETFGVMVYQEDVMKVAHHIAGFSLADADVLRRAMSGKERSKDQMQATCEKFLAGAGLNGIPAPTAKEIWRQISSFCGYAFCKAHSASYAVLSLELLWFKTHHPALFMAAVINNRGGFYATQAYISEAQRMGLSIQPPDINQSEADFTCTDKVLWVGLSFISCLQTNTIARILQQRKIRAFDSLENFIERIKPDEREFASLVNSGALQQFGPPAACRWREKLMIRNTLFDEPATYLTNFNAPALSFKETIRSELESMGFAVSGHPSVLWPRSPEIISAVDLPGKVNHRVKVQGILIAVKSVTTSSGASMKFFTIEDNSGLIEVVFFPAAWKKNAILLDQAAIVEVSGTVKQDQGQFTVHGVQLKNMSP